LGVPWDKVDDNRLYRGLDELLRHKQELEVFLKQRFGELFAIVTVHTSVFDWSCAMRDHQP
jgi:hypothetical protein